VARYQRGEVTLEALRADAPFLAREIKRAGLPVGV
jgi:hypothetical protein